MKIWCNTEEAEAEKLRNKAAEAENRTRKIYSRAYTRCSPSIISPFPHFLFNIWKSRCHRNTKHLSEITFCDIETRAWPGQRPPEISPYGEIMETDGNLLTTRIGASGWRGCWTWGMPVEAWGMMGHETEDAWGMSDIIFGLLLTVLALVGFIFNIYIVLALLLTKQVRNLASFILLFLWNLVFV